MRLWRNWQTRKTKDLVFPRHAGSSPVNRTMASVLTAFERLAAKNTRFFFIQRAEPRRSEQLHFFFCLSRTAGWTRGCFFI